MINIGNKTWTVIGLALLMSSIGCKTTGVPKLPRLGWLGPREAETVVAAETKPATELPPPSSAAVPKSPIRQAAASQASFQSNATANAAVNTEPLTAYPATPYPNFQVAQTNSPAAQNSTAGPYRTAAAQPSGNTPIPQAPAAQPQAQQGFYDTNYDASAPLSPQQPADAYVPNYSMPTPEASSSLVPSTRQNPVTASPYAGQHVASANMPAAQASPQQSFSPQNHDAAPISTTIPTGANSAAATYMTEAQAAPSQTDALPSSPSYYSTAQQQADSPWRPGSTACQNGTCFALPGSAAGGTSAASQAAPQVAQPYQTQTGTSGMATQPEGMQAQGSSNRESTWR